MDNRDGIRPLFGRPPLASKAQAQTQDGKTVEGAEDKVVQGKETQAPSAVNPESSTTFRPAVFSVPQAFSSSTHVPSPSTQPPWGFAHWGPALNAVSQSSAPSGGSQATMTFGMPFLQNATQDASKWWNAASGSGSAGSFAAGRESGQRPQTQVPAFGQTQMMPFNRPALAQTQSPWFSSQLAGGAGKPPGAGSFQSQSSLPTGKENTKPFPMPRVGMVETERASIGRTGIHPSSTAVTGSSSAPSATSVASSIPLVPFVAMDIEEPDASAVSKRKRDSAEMSEGKIPDAPPMQVAVASPKNGSLVFRPGKNQFPKLTVALTRGVRDHLARFYFGVLATQAFLLPRFKYNVSTKRKNRGKWGATLTMYGHTIQGQFPHASRVDAKTAACRVALKTLRNEHSDWTVPGEPAECPIPSGWNWVEILRDYCIQNGLPAPKYTGGLQADGYMYEVEVGEISYFGALEHYAQDWDSRNSAAHVAMYSMLVNGEEGRDDLSPRLMLRDADEKMLAMVPRKPPPGDPPAMAAGQKRSAEPITDANESQKSKKAKTGGQSFGSTGANTLPLVKNRLAAYEKPLAKEESRWKYTPREIRAELTGMHNPRERLEKICRLLLLEFPRTDSQFHNVGRETTYNAAAYFPNDPFLSRVGPIGEVKYARGSVEALDACCAETVEYLIDMVQEDLELENKRAQPEPISSGSNHSRSQRSLPSEGARSTAGILKFDV